MSAPPDRRPCVCRGWIEPDAGGNAAITEAVADHNETAQHQTWRYDELLHGGLVLPETPAEQLRRHLGVPVPAVRPVITDPEHVPSRRRPDPWGGAL